MNTALIIVNPQNDHITNTSEQKLLKELNTLVTEHREQFDHIIITREWRKIENPNTFQNISVKKKCIAETFGADLAEPLKETLINHTISASLRKDLLTPSQTEFEAITEDGGNLKQILEELKISDILITGFIRKNIVEKTLVDAVSFGYNTTFLADYIKLVEDDNELEAPETFLGKFSFGPVCGECGSKRCPGAWGRPCIDMP